MMPNTKANENSFFDDGTSNIIDKGGSSENKQNFKTSHSFQGD
jgi:hypothetical protein